MSLLEPEDHRPKREPSTWGCASTLAGIIFVGVLLYVAVNRLLPGLLPNNTSGGSIPLGGSVSDYIGGGDRDRWEFQGQQGDYISIRMDGSFDTYLELENADGQTLAENDDYNSDTRVSLIPSFQLPYDGTYTVIARGWSDSSSGTYTLSLQVGEEQAVQVQPATAAPTLSVPGLSQPTALPDSDGRIEYGQTVSGRVTDDQGDLWSFRGNTGDIITIDMTGDFDTYLVLYDSDNRELTRDDDSGEDNNARIAYYVLPYDGTYNILARGWAGRTGSYELTLNSNDFIPTDVPPTSTPAPERAGTIEYGQTVSSRVTTEGGESWTFRANDGDIVTIDMEGDFDTYLLLYDSDNRELRRDDDSGEDNNARIAYYVLPYDGTYTIVARGWAGRTGSYSLTLRHDDFIPTPTTAPAPRLPLPTRAGSISYGETVSGTVRDFGGDAWTFRGEEGDRVTIDMEGEFDTYLVLADSDYRQLAYDDDSGSDLNSRIRNFTLPADGTYIIVARGYSGRTGDYTLTLEGR
ncbi:MAG: PPC domain-containing protein [Anaerolineae bacterium]